MDRLAAAGKKLPREDLREVAAMVLERVAALRSDPPADD